MKILIVDDSKAMRMIVRRTLRQAGFDGHDVEEAENGQDALAQIASWKPDLVLSDWNMPIVNGIELPAHPACGGQRCPVRFRHLGGNRRHARTASEAGAAFLIAKPFTDDAVPHGTTPVLT